MGVHGPAYRRGPYREIEALEVKYRTQIDGRGVQGARRALPGRPLVVATKDTLDFRSDHALIPSALALWALG